MPKGIPGSGKERAPRKSPVMRVAETATATLDKRIKSLQSTIDGLSAKHAAALKKVEDRYAGKLAKLGDELKRTRALTQQLDGFLSPTAAPVSPTNRASQPAPVAGAPRQPGGRAPGEPAAMQTIIDWLRGSGQMVEIIEAGKKYKLNRIWATRDELLTAANRDRKNRGLSEFASPAA